ncbi:putative FAD-dependent isoamyl alcohol oxidase [Cryphonectria parasitica EP155]|uniref:FAD-dependent isoamyl alcohol oxidase n=1 Tax=Cryphonectria parasitica (strain ATCC 38755 / EP155) TaxID=660469 RepID=A0A9P4Y1M6_CRYP1|nr:putative FAD-dependent isoamyl alcohol oxidase [Cryphonectria parasitica EP155]KAF3765307.1 putative FAD-dependent isoamyl alcohol oxidase [Cryphonectria parasitica EP155]
MAVFTRSLLTSLFLGLVSADASCRVIPGDPDWPSTSTWQSLNETVGGRLIATVPLPSVCHANYLGTLVMNDTYSTSECAAVQAEWLQDIVFIEHPAEVMNPYFQNQSCDPFTSKSVTCELGNYVSYSINVTGVDDVVAGLNFAKENNVRLVIKNTGHDFTGKSTGKGGLALWTHYLNTTDIIESYTNGNYTGPAVKLGAGVVGAYVYPAVAAAGYRVLGGECQTVGLAGGYTSGGGHSLLNGLYGMAADAVLEWEVVTVDGEHLIATPFNNTDLYWALTGGGAGTFGVVLSMTTKIFEDGPIGSGSLSFNSTEENFWEAIEDLWAWLPQFVDAGPNTFDFAISTEGFSTIALTIPDKNETEVAQVMQPYFDALNARNVSYDFTPIYASNYLDYYNEWFGIGITEAGPANIQLASRLIPRAGVLDATQNKEIVAAMKAYTDAEYWIVGCHALNVADSEHYDNAVLPQWRSSVATCNIASQWEWDVEWSEMQARKTLMANTLMPGLENATLGAGTYLNEVDAQWKGGPTGWKNELYGVNYDRLLDIKNQYDPDHLLYAWLAVGSEYWTVDGSGRLCSAD